MKKSAWITIAVLVLAGAGGLALWQQQREGGAEPEQARKEQVPAASPAHDRVRYPEGAAQLTMIQSRAIPASPIPTTDPLSARIAYDENVTARIGAGFSGRIVAVKAAPGDKVKAGQVLAEIDSPDYGSARADLDKARSDEERKRLVLERARELVAGEGVAAKDIEMAQAEYAQARAETARADMRLRNLNPASLPVRGQRIGLVSPVSGVVTERSATLALEVGPGQAAPLFVVTDPNRLWLMIDLPERLLSRLKLGNTVMVESDAYPGERFDAKIMQTGQVVDQNTRRIPVRARLDNPDGVLLPEMFVRATLYQDRGSGVQVPNSAIVHRGVYSYVFVETAPGEFQRREVKLLAHGSETTYVAEGLKGGERVVVTGAMLLDAEISALASGSAS